MTISALPIALLLGLLNGGGVWGRGRGRGWGWDDGASSVDGGQAAFSVAGVDVAYENDEYVSWIQETHNPVGSREPSESSRYKLEWPVKRVAIIGAGPSGMIAYRELINAGFSVHVFERDDSPGGNWHYTDETPLDAPVPNVDVVIGDYVPSLPPGDVELPYTECYEEGFAEMRRDHRGPKPVWASLKSNAPAPVQQIPEIPWPVGTTWELTHEQLQRYMRTFASFHGLNANDNNPNISFNTRVERVAKRYDGHGGGVGWSLVVKELQGTGDDSARATWRVEDFDAVVVATGRFTAPYIPPIEGLAEWKKRFPDRLTHSRQYRRPQIYADKTVVIVGAATSGGEISRDLSPWAKKIYQSIRPDNSSAKHFVLDNFLRRVPDNTTFVPEIKRFLPLDSDSAFTDGQIELKNGTIISGIDHIIFATGFRYSFPFLPQYHNASIGLNDSAPPGQQQPLVTDGTHIRSLHLDLFYIEEPTIGFLNMNLGMQSFVYAEYLTVALAKVWDEKAHLPSTPDMWRMYDDRLRDRGGYGRHFQFLGPERNDDNIRYFIGWLNAAAVRYGGRQLDGPPKGVDDISTYWSVARFGGYRYTVKSSEYSKLLRASGLGDGFDGLFSDGYGSLEEEREAIYNRIFNDWW